MAARAPASSIGTTGSGIVHFVTAGAPAMGSPFSADIGTDATAVLAQKALRVPQFLSS